MERNESKRTVFIGINLFVFAFSIYLLSAPDPFAYLNADTWQLRFEVTKAIVEKLDISIPRDVGMTGADGRTYSGDSIGADLLAIPFYLIAKLIGVNAEITVLGMNILFGAATVLLVFYFCMVLGYSQRSSIILSILYGFGTMAWPLSKQPFDHAVETFFVLLSIYTVYLYTKKREILYLLFSGVALGVAFITRPTSLLVIPPIFALIFISYKKEAFSLQRIAKDMGLFSLCMLPFFCIFAFHNYYRFGSIFETGYVLLGERLSMAFFSGTPLMVGISGLLISPGKGFFYYSPVAILFFFSIRSFLKKYPDLGSCFILVAISYLLFFSKNINWHGDWAWGPRYLLVVTPLLIIPVGQLFDLRNGSKKRFRQIIIGSLLAISLVIQIAAISVDYRKYFFSFHFDEKIDFKIRYGEGVQQMTEPLNQTYFEFEKSPILAQFKFVAQIAQNIRYYKYSQLPSGASPADQINAHPCMNLYDFWWVHRYFFNHVVSALAIGLIVLMGYCGSRLWKEVR